MPMTSQLKKKLAEARTRMETPNKTYNRIRANFAKERSPSMARERIAMRPEKMAKSFHLPIGREVRSLKIPNARKSAPKRKRRRRKKSKIPKERGSSKRKLQILPRDSKRTEERNIVRKSIKREAKVPNSNDSPPKETPIAGERSADSAKPRTTRKPPANNKLFGIEKIPSFN